MVIRADTSRRLYALVNTYNLDRQERHDFALMVIGYDGSWRHLTQAQAEDLIVGLTAHASLVWILQERSRRLRAQWAKPVNDLPPVAPRRE